MAVHTLTLTLPEQIYQRLKAQAQAAARPVDEVAVEAITRSLPPSIEPDLPLPLQEELKAIERLSDEALWQVARSEMNPDKVALYDVLLERLQLGTLTPEGRELLTHLRQEADALMLRKAQAYALLQSRGHQLPTLEELHTQSA